MPIDHPLFLLVAVPWTLACVALLGRMPSWRVGDSPRAANGIDGLRGFLALGVVFHHAVAWGEFSRSGVWKSPASRLFDHLGGTNVNLFFMITAFLFWNKAIDSRNRPFPWTRFLVGRVYRLYPLYLVACLLVFATVAIGSGFSLQTSFPTLATTTFRWLLFTIPGSPASLLDLNGWQATSQILATATWTLPYEWFFYAALPLGALVFRVPPVLVLVASLATTTLIWIAHGHILVPQLLPFAAGMAVAHLTRHQALRRILQHPMAGWGSLALLLVACYRFPLPSGLAPQFCASGFFLVIASGNSLSGLLTSRPVVHLGEISYGVYLLHGFLLFLAFGALHPAPLAAELHWGVILLILPLLLLATTWLHHRVERPAILATHAATQWLQDRFTRR